MGRLVTAVVIAGALGLGATAQEAEREAWLSPGTRVGEEIVGANGGALVWVPAGSFMMGATEADMRYALGRLEGWGARIRICRPVHKVRISRGFWIGKHEVTNAQYHRYCEATGAEFRDKEEQGLDHPVRFITWDDAAAYCRHYGLVLPTEAQWEYAARGPENRWFPWGNEWDSRKCSYERRRGPGGETWPVGSFPDGASWCGALDMAGNLKEWCQDWYDRLYYEASPETDPTGPTSGEYRVVRGGSAGNGPWVCRCAQRTWALPDEPWAGQGFRVCVTP